jgi:hypothetical protein
VWVDIYSTIVNETGLSPHPTLSKIGNHEKYDDGQKDWWKYSWKEEEEKKNARAQGKGII